MGKVETLLRNCPTIDEMIDRGDIHDAVRFSGELLAQADALWSAARNNKESSIEEITVLGILAAYHCDALAMMGNHQDAYATAITALFEMAVDGHESLSLSQSALQLYCTAIVTLMQILRQQLIPHDETSQQHINEIMRYLASMLYYYYNHIGKSRSDFPHLQVAYQILSQLRANVEIQSPTITVLDQEISPNVPLPLFSDLVGRSQAMGLMGD